MTAIDPLARSVFETAPDRLRPFLEGLAARVSGGSNWLVRKKTVCDLLLGLDAFFALPAAERQSLMADGGAPADADTEGGPEDFRRVLPIYVGAILEGLGETTISSAEQAAVYILSIHPEHQAAAERWMLADPRNGKSLRRLMRGDRRYRQLMDRMADHWRAGRST
ncbi:hypothetical protein VY88_06565 [Azospirillum thiophilum]|uniref:Uncharacterized protein n=1 Tax=Azospirillum thiophilum TaxID=528244 RepID=A0AAC8VWD2_9PROT|nr:hypothetical protein [Azospirillum thiophilum]ALG70562.1 hypothetical protein AL072_06145 [Azospirillum thiophilum]KJR65767.1 hypothetical protein VY88_06565 [Azospirillum thiophilum]